MIISVFCLNDNKSLYFDAAGPREALEKTLYYLNLSQTDKNAQIKTTKSRRCLYFEHGNKTYSVLNN